LSLVYAPVSNFVMHPQRHAQADTRSKMHEVILELVVYSRLVPDCFPELSSNGCSIELDCDFIDRPFASSRLGTRFCFYHGDG
jgi:hypothetical protein